MFVDLHLDGAPEKVSYEVRQKHADLAKEFAQTITMPQYVVLSPHDRKVMSTWTWENADVKKWKSRLEDALMRWKNRAQ